ncbi:MAG: Fic family protein [Pasteurellaceae bacterium]|nr:Fic family protein [Pasteurellaceae bacterium]
MADQDFFYLTETPNEWLVLLADVDRLNDELNQLKKSMPENANLWQTITEKLRATWTYHSNALEGSTLSLGETIFFLREGLTIQGKPFKDFADAKNHAQAIDYLFDIVADRRVISENLIKEINALLLQGVHSTPAKTLLGQAVNKPLRAGEYKILPNHVLKQDGTIHKYVEPEQVSPQMQQLVDYINNAISVHPIIRSAVAHYNMVRIHPFDDGNGRGARLLMNLILIKAGYFPAVVKNEEKFRYLETLNQADQGDISVFIRFILTQLKNTLQNVIDDLNKL